MQKKIFKGNTLTIKTLPFRGHFYYIDKYKGAANRICKLKYGIPKECPVAFNNGSNCGYHFIIKKLAKKFEGKFNCLGENTQKHKTFPVPRTKEVQKIGKNVEETTKNISYRLLFIDRARFMASSLSNRVDNLAKGIHRIKCKYGHDN